MIKDLYIRPSNDPNYISDAIEITDKIESILTKVKMILGTPPASVLGDVSFGIGIEELVFQTNINKYKLEEKINSQIREYVSESSEYKITTDVSFGRNENYDYCIIDILINNTIIAGILVS
ncbi:MAG: hypothetical protein ACRDD8_14265 [Bacteroidales bacterium]